jgi:RNA polymerase sigma-70 factor, ECF subfamily
VGARAPFELLRRPRTAGTVWASQGNSHPMGDDTGLSTDADVVVASWDEPSAFAVLFDRHAGVVCRFVAGRAPRNDIDDLVSETFVAAFRSRKRYDRHYDDARPWLLGIAVNVLRHHYRAEARRRRRPWSSQPEEPTGDHAEGVASGLDARSGWEHVVRALSQLDDRYREVLLLTASADLTYEEMARALGVPVGTVRSRVARGRRQLRELLDAEGQHKTWSRLSHSSTKEDRHER